MQKLLNWDHDEVNPTSLEDVFLNICEVSRKFTGREVRVRVEDNHLLVIEQLMPEKVERKLYDGHQDGYFVDEIKTSAYWRTAVVLDLYNYGREVVGRLHHVVGGVGGVALGIFVDKEINKSYHENK